MSNRPVRSLEKLYDLNNILFEMASVVERSSRIQGPFEESDFEHQRMSPGKFTDQNRVMFSGDTRVESGTCNVCSAPCSSCMHRRAVAMETSVDCGSSDTTFLRKEGDNCSFNGVNHRSCTELRTAASETSNLLSGSSNDSCCENAESKATLRDSFTCDNSEAVDMLPEVSTVKTIKEETFSEKRISDVGFEMSCTDSRVMQDGEFDEGHRMSTCHKNNDSCTSEATYGNMLDLDLDKRDTPCSSLSTPKCSTKETEMMIQVEKVTHESRVCLTEANMINSTKLSGLLREPFHKKSPGPINVNFSTKSDLSNPSSRKNILSKLTSNSPSLSNHISSENPEDSIDLDATKPSNFQSASHECLVVKDEASARDLLSTDNEVSKSIHIKSGAPSLESKNEEQCAISATDFGRPEYSLHTSETQLQPILDGRASDLDNMLYDVKVCDICGDAGREELLATCSRCVDGAEHTYCMRIMLNKVPEGDWFCEECQLKEKIATRKLNEAEPKFGTSSVPSLNKKIQNLGNFTNIESSRKLVVGSSIPETSASIKEMESPRITSKRHVDQVDDSSTARKKVSEPKYESTKLATPKVDTVFSRVGSSRNLHVAEAKGGSATLSSESRRTNVSRTFSFSLKLDSRGNAFKNLHVAEATRSSKNSSPVGQSTNSWTLSRSPGSLSRQISFRKNFEPKVKKLMEGVPRNLAKDSTSKDKKMLAVARRQLSKSASFNSVSSEHQNIGTIIKAQSFKSRLEDPLVLKPIKERNISFVSDYPDVVQPPNKRMHLPKMDSKTAVPTRDLNNKFESNTLDGGRSENNSGYNEAKKQSSFKCERHGIYDSEDKRAGDLIKNKATQADSGATDTSYKEVGGVTNNASLADCSLQVQSDDKVIVTSSPGASRAPNSVIKPVLVHDKPKETIHSSQSCEIDRLASTAAKPSVVVSLVEGTTKKNKWKDAATAAMLERKRSRTVDQSESMSNNIIYEGPSQSTLTNSSCQKDLPLVGAGASCGKEVVRDSYTDYSKTDGADVQQIKHSMESSYVPAVEGTTKKNKWKDAAKAAMLERKRSRTVDQSESMSNNIIYEGPSQSTLTNSRCQKDLPLVGAGASSGKEVVRDSYSDYSKTEGADVQQIKHSMESSYVPAVEGTTKKNKWKDAAKAAMLERKRSRTVDQSESMSNNIINEGPSQSTLTNSSCQKDLPLVGAGASCGKEVVRDSYTDYSKTDGADVQQIKHSMESSYVPAVEGTTKKNKWKDAAKAAMLERKRSRTVDQSESMSNNIIYEGPSQSILTNSSCQKDLPLVRAGASCGKEVVGDSYADYSKTDGADVQQIKHSMDSSYVPAVVDLNADPTIIHDSIEKSTIQILSDHPSLFTTTCRALAIPEHEFIWQGAFEILRIGRLPETVDGIQAHLSNVSSPKVHELACQFPCKIQLEEVPRVSLWPLQFQDIGPEENDIALYFFAKDAESYEKSYQKLLEAAVNNDLALKGNINEMELLIFPSSMLPASSQRWNMLFFLWGIFRVRKSDSSIPCASLRERPCGTKTTAEPHDEDVSPSPACELSTFQQPNSQRYPPKEVSRSNESCGASRMKHDSSVDCHAVSSTSPENNIHRVEDLHYKSVAETETTDLSVDSSHSCSKSYSFNQKERCSAEEIYETKLGNKNTEFDLARVPLINANDEHKLSKSSPGYSIASCFREDEEIKKGRLVKIEAESEVKLTDGVCPSWVSRPNRKRALSCSETISGEVSESTKAIMWQPKESCFVCTEDDRDHKRMNCNSEGPASNNCRVASVERNFPSSTRCPYEQRSDDANYNNVIESTKCPERCFFPVDSHRVGSDAVENFRFFLPPVNEESPDSSIPDLELALGGKKSSSRKQTVSLFSPSVDRGKLGKLSGSIFDDDDMSEALSLSLAFPSVDRKRTDDTEQKDQPTVNTHLFLFGGFTDA